MRSLAVALILLSTPALASTAPECVSLSKAQHVKGTTVAPLTRAQFYFLSGAYAITPPVGLPPGDGAVMLTDDSSGNAMILWTRGPLVCKPFMAVPKALMKMLADLKAGAGEDGGDL